MLCKGSVGKACLIVTMYTTIFLLFILFALFVVSYLSSRGYLFFVFGLLVYDIKFFILFGI